MRNDEVVKIIALLHMKVRLEEFRDDPVASTPEEFAIRIKGEIDIWAKVIRAFKASKPIQDEDSD
jgi:hypothetical protein